MKQTWFGEKSNFNQNRKFKFCAAMAMNFFILQHHHSGQFHKPEKAQSLDHLPSYMTSEWTKYWPIVIVTLTLKKTFQQKSAHCTIYTDPSSSYTPIFVLIFLCDSWGHLSRVFDSLQDCLKVFVDSGFVRCVYRIAALKSQWQSWLTWPPSPHPIQPSAVVSSRVFFHYTLPVFLFTKLSVCLSSFQKIQKNTAPHIK